MKQVRKNTFDLFLEIDLLSIDHATKYLNVMHPPKKNRESSNHEDIYIQTINLIEIWFETSDLCQLIKQVIYNFWIQLIKQSAKLSGSPKPNVCKIVHGRMKWVVPQAWRACEKKVI